jgi:hypothetical protein
MLFCEWGWAIKTGSLACHSGISGPSYPCIVSGWEGEVQGVSPDFQNQASTQDTLMSS